MSIERKITKFFTIDSETLAKHCFGKILSISIVYFNLDEPTKDISEMYADGDIFHMNFDISEQTNYGLVSDASTVDWWKSQIAGEENPEFRKRILTEIHNGKSTFKDFGKEFNEWIATKIQPKEDYYVFERQLGFDRERYNLICMFSDTPTMLDHFKFADVRTWIRKSDLPSHVVTDCWWKPAFVEKLFQGHPYSKHHSVDDALLDGFMVKLVVQKGLTKI